MRNRYAGTCYYCNEIVPKGEGHFERIRYQKSDQYPDAPKWYPGAPRWRTIHANCCIKQRKEKELLREQNGNTSN